MTYLTVNFSFVSVGFDEKQQNFEIWLFSDCPYPKILFNDNMGRSCQNCQGRDNREESKSYQAKTVKNHGSKLPITFYSTALLIISDLISDHFYLLENETQFSGHAAGVGGVNILLL